MYTLRITKYNPKLRDNNGWYLLDEWTESYQIGEKFNGKEFTEEEYLEMEKYYIETCISAMQELHLKKMEVHWLEVNDFDTSFSGNDELKDLYSSIKDRTWLNINEVRKYLKLVFRNYLWGYLDSGKKGKMKLIIHTGYDYYMYFIVNDKLKNTRLWAKEHHLFPEVMPAYWAFPKRD